MILVGNHDIVGTWVMHRTGGRWVCGSGSAIGVLKNGTLIGGVTFTNWNGNNVWMDVAGEGRWLTRELLRVVFDYVFNQMGCQRVSGLVEATNEKARKFDEHLGFRLEATLEGAGATGDLLVYRMFRHECRFLESVNG